MLEYRNTIYYYTLLSYPATLLNLFIGFNHFFRGYLRFFYIQYHHLQIETVLLTPFETGCLLFLFWLGSPIQCLMECKSRHFCIVPDLRTKAFNHSPFSMTLAVSFSQMLFISLMKFPSIFSLLSVFIIKRIYFCALA